MTISSHHTDHDSMDNRRHKPERFMFDVSFDMPEPVAEDLPPPPPVFSEEELAAAAEQAHAQGFEEGKQAALQELEQQLVHQIESFRRELSELEKIKRQQDAQVTSQAVGLTVASLKQLLPSLNQSQAITEIRELISQAIKQQLSHATLAIRLHPSLVDPVGKCFAGEDIKLIGDETQPFGDCLIAWPGGSLARRAHQAATELQSKLGAYLADTQQDSQEMVAWDEQQTKQTADISVAMDNMPSLADSESMVIEGEVAPQDVEVVQVVAEADSMGAADSESKDGDEPVSLAAIEVASANPDFINPDDIQPGEMQ